MADIEPSPTGNTYLPPLTSQFPQWSRATPLASLPPHLRSDGINGFLRVGNLILLDFFNIFFCFCAQFKKQVTSLLCLSLWAQPGLVWKTNNQSTGASWRISHLIKMTNNRPHFLNAGYHCTKNTKFGVLANQLIMILITFTGFS